MRIDRAAAPAAGLTLTLRRTPAAPSCRGAGWMADRRRAPWRSERTCDARAAAVGRTSLQVLRYSTRSAVSPPTPAPILLESERFEPPHQSISTHARQPPIIILHGLFGSKQNWRSLAKRLSQATQKDVYTLDLRNHGESPATPGATSYLDYASDVKLFMKTHELTGAILIGHSMGGKVAMTLALESASSADEDDAGLIDKLVAVDISPAKGPISTSFQVYIDGFKEINSSAVSSRKQADEILAKYEQDLGRRQFLLTNLKKGETADGGAQYSIRLPVEVLEEQLARNHVGDFPFDPASEPGGPGCPVRFDKPALFIKGAHSKYINKYNIPTIAAFFRNHKLVVLDTDHWVHAEKPNEFIETVVDFVKEE